MKVLVISHLYPSSFNEAAGIFVHEQVRALVKAGVEVRVISPIPWTPWPVKHLSRKWRAISGVPRGAVWDGSPVHYPRYLVFPRAWFFGSSGRRMYRGIRKLADVTRRDFAFDLIHAHVALPDGFAAAAIADISGKPFVTTIHGQDAYSTAAKNRSCKAGVLKVFDSTSRIIAVSDRLKQTLVEQLGSQYDTIITVIGNGVSLDKVIVQDQPQEDTSVQTGWAGLLSVGYLIERKGHRYVLLALSRILERGWNVRYIVVGDGPEREKLERLTKSLGLDNVVRFVGMVSHRDAMTYMSKCDFFVLPSWDEAFGVVYVEAMAHGKPVVACKGEGIDGIVTHRETGMLVEPRSVDSLVEALDFLLSHPDEVKAIGERARRLVLENYTWEKNAEKTIQVYKEVLNVG